MIHFLRPVLFTVLSLGPIALAQSQAAAIARLPVTTRPEILARAKRFATHTWTCGQNNVNASCFKSYKSELGSQVR